MLLEGLDTPRGTCSRRPSVKFFGEKIDILDLFASGKSFFSFSVFF